MSTPVEDIQLMKRIQQQEQQALSLLYDQYGGAVYSIVMRILNNTTLAEEVTQDVFLRVWNSAEKWDSNRGKLISWLLTISRRIAIDRIRKENRQPDVIATALDEMFSPPATASIANDPMWQDGLIIHRLMGNLPPEQAQVIQLGFFAGYSHREIAENLDIPLGTIKTRIRLGLQKLREMWLVEHEQINE